jgi:hypothetical protein
MKQDGCWHFYPGTAELHLGAWSVRQDGEGFAVVLDGFDTVDQRLKLGGVGDE